MIDLRFPLVVVATILASNRPATACAAGQWNFQCSVKELSVAPMISNVYADLGRIDLRFCFDNRGGLFDDMAVINHVGKSTGYTASPFSWFNIVRLRGNEAHHRISWSGSEYRGTPKTLRMEAHLVSDAKFLNISYTENLYYNRQHIGRLITACVSVDQ